MPTRRLALPVLAIGTALMLAGCGSNRFSGGAPISTASAAPARPVVEEQTVVSVPAGSVRSEPLAPLGGEPVAPAPSALPTPAPETRPVPPPVQQSANAAPTRSSSVGAWTAREAPARPAACSCRARPRSISTAPPRLAAPTATSRRSAPGIIVRARSTSTSRGGTVAARLRGNAGSLEGVLSKSGAPLTLVR